MRILNPIYSIFTKRKMKEDKQEQEMSERRINRVKNIDLFREKKTLVYLSVVPQYQYLANQTLN